MAYTVQPIAEEKIEEQKAAYTALLQSLGQATFAEVDKTLSTREKVRPEKGLTPDEVKALRGRIARQKSAA